MHHTFQREIESCWSSRRGALWKEADQHAHNVLQEPLPSLEAAPPPCTSGSSVPRGVPRHRATFDLLASSPSLFDYPGFTSWSWDVLPGWTHPLRAPVRAWSSMEFASSQPPHSSSPDDLFPRVCLLCLVHAPITRGVGRICVAPVLSGLGRAAGGGRSVAHCPPTRNRPPPASLPPRSLHLRPTYAKDCP